MRAYNCSLISSSVLGISGKISIKFFIGLRFLLYLRMILLALCLILLPNSFLTRFTNFTPVFSPITLLPLFVRLIPPPFTPRPPCFSSFTPVTIDDVSSLLSQSPDTNCDLDPIPTSLLKKCSHVLLPTITNIINLSISTICLFLLVSFLITSKAALFILTSKKANLDKEDLSSYRPISHLSFLSKITERVVKLRLTDVLPRSCAMCILGRECTVGADDCVREISVATDQQQPFTFTNQSIELGEEESGSSIARKRWSDNSFLKPFQLTGQLSGFPNLHMLYSIFCCLPVSSASAERALSKLKIVKNCLRTSMTDDTLGSLLLLAAEQDLMTQLTSDDIIARLVKSHPSLKSHLLF